MGALALFVSVAFLGTTVLTGVNGQPAAFPEPPFENIDRYVAVGSPSSVRFPEQLRLILDCLPHAISTYGVHANLSSIQWFRIATRSPETIGVEAEITDNSTQNIFLAANKERLFIDSITITTGAQVGTEAAYRCRVCRNVPPEPKVCAEATTTVNAESPPILECVDPPAPYDPDEFFSIRDMNIGCDLCIEPGQSFAIVTIMCVPRTSRTPFDCVLTTPNGTNVLDIVDPSGNEITVQRAGDIVSSVSIAPVENPDTNPLGFDVLGAWTCRCNNSDGRSVASSKLESCLVPPLIDKGIPKPPFIDFPPYIGPECHSFKIGSNDFLLEGQSFTISCPIIAGDPAPSVTWSKNGVNLPQYVNRSTITVPTGPSSDSRTAEGAGAYTCTATNPAGTDMATSRMRAGIEILRPPEIVKGQPQPVPPTVNYVDQSERIGTDVHVISGRMATIMCQLGDAGLPAAMIEWTRNGRPLNESHYPLTNGRENLVIPSVSEADEATYCCSAENAAGIDSACSGLFVRGGGPFITRGTKLPLTAPMIRRGVLPENTTAKPVAVGTGQTRVISNGTSVRIRCELTSVTMPPSDIIWKKFVGGETEDITDCGSKFTIVSTGHESELTVAMFGADDVGNYQCIASNIVGSDAASVKLELCPPDATPCSPVTNDTFNVVLEVTEGLDDTCTYCAMWHVTEFGPCDPPCHLGMKRRYVRCETSDARHSFDDAICNASRAMPPRITDCKADFPTTDLDARACRLSPQWKIWPWSMCSRTCQGGKQTRNVKCIVPRTGVPMPDSACPGKPATHRPCNEGVTCAAVFPVPPLKDVDRYVAVGSPSSVRFPEQLRLILDCLPHSISTYGVHANLSSIQWFRIATRSPETVGVEAEIIDNSTQNIFLAANKERLFIDSITITTGAQVGTEAAYRCRVCRNVPPEPKVCAEATTTVNAQSPPILECVDPPAPFDPDEFFSIRDMNIGCDLCIEPGQSFAIVTIMCIPRTSRTPFDCVMTTPNGTNVLDIVDPSGNEITVQRAGDIVSSVSIAPVENPDTNPLGFDVLGTWTCRCNNSDGRSVASSKLGSCLVPPLIDKGISKPPFVDFPPYVGPESRSFKIGSNDFLLEGQSFTISCPIIAGDPAPSVTWSKNGVNLPQYVNRSTITVPTGPSSDSRTAEGAGAYTCTATNPVGTDSATSRMRAGIEILHPPRIVKGQPQPVPPTVDYVDQSERIGTDVHVISGRMATIMCQLGDAGLPEAMIQWTRNGRPLHESHYTLTIGRENLVLPVVSEADEATYCCSAENAAGIDSACSGLFVRGGGPFLRKGTKLPFPVNPVRVYPGRQTVDIGGNAFTVRGSGFEALCPVTFSEPAVTNFMWTYIGAGGVETTIANHDNSSMSMLRIGNTVFMVTTDLGGQMSCLLATGNDPGFMVRCTATSPLGTDTATSEFFTFVPPIIDEGVPSDIPLEIDRENFFGKIGSTLHVVEGQSATIPCEIFAGTGEPEGSVDYAWYYMGMQIKNGRKFTITVDEDKGSSTLMVNNFIRADNGQITCVAFNPAGQDQASSDVFVYSDVLIDKGDNSTEIGPDEPLTGKVGDKFLVPIGKRAFINCDLADAGGFPYNSSVSPPLPGRVQWFKDGQLVDLTLFSSSHGNQLCVDVRSANDSGNYQCKVTSRIVNERTPDDLIFQMSSATSNLMVLSAPMIRRGVLPENTTAKPIAVGTGQTRVISSNTSVRIRCELTSVTEPSSDIIWKRFAGGEMENITDYGSKFTIVSTGSESELTVAMFGADDVGNYQCIASNIIGSDAASVKLELCPPDATPCSPVTNDTFNVVLEVTEGLDDTCTYCAMWHVTGFGPCEPPCHLGMKRRYVRCETSDGRHSFNDAICSASRAMPPKITDCKADFPTTDLDARACRLSPQWKIWPWSMCSRTCQGGKQTRNVKCVVPRTGVPMPDSACPGKPATHRPCNEGVICGCIDVYPSCKYVDGKLCAIEQIRENCCATCTGGRSKYYH